jgi:hypothetical protein
MITHQVLEAVISSHYFCDQLINAVSWFHRGFSRSDRTLFHDQLTVFTEDNFVKALYA